MVQLLRAVLAGAGVGVVLGAVARGLMRLVAIGMTIEPEFHTAASIGVVSLFAVSGAGAGIAAVLPLDRWLRGLVLLVASIPLLLFGGAFTVGEVGEVRDRDLDPIWTGELLALSTLIVALALITPYAAWRAGRRAGR